MRWLEQSIPWTDRTQWAIPECDRHMVTTITTARDIDAMMFHVERRGVCVQAGGAVGIWPLRFACFFDRVITFEPSPDNWACLVENTRDCAVIEAHHAALCEQTRRVSIRNDTAGNWGAGYIVADANGVTGMPLDLLLLPACDLIQLDIEGAELEALQGAEATILSHRPVIVLEEKPLRHVQRDPAAARQWLVARRYREAERVGRDVIMVPL